MYNRLFFFIILFALIPSQASSWDDKKTHPTLTEKAVKTAANFKDVLTSQLGFKKKFDEKLSNGKKTLSITEWLKLGSKKEDDPICRADDYMITATRIGGLSHA